MNTFNTLINNIINESVIDIPRNSLDITVFEFPDSGPPIMHSMIKTQIMNDIEQFKDIVKITVYFAVGSILTKNYTAHSDIDICVQINSPDDIIIESIFDLIRRLNGKLAVGTTHPINYYVINDNYDLDKAEAAYDVANETWIKEPTNINLNTTKYMDQFQDTVSKIDFSAAELRRDIIDFESLKKMNNNQIKDLESKTQAKLDEIEDNIKTLIQTYTNVKNIRKDAFKKDMSPTEIRKYGSKNRLPENVIYKLLERYYYFDFIIELKHILKDISKDNNITNKDMSTIKSAGKNFWK